MNNDNHRISANEINKFSYCPYQWYYERVYGTKELRRLKNELNIALGCDDKIGNNFSRGNKFHNKVHRIYNFKVLVAKLAFLGILIFLLYLFFKGLVL